MGFPPAPIVLFLFPAIPSYFLGLFCPSTGRKAHTIDGYWLEDTLKPKFLWEKPSKGLVHTVLFSPKLAKTSTNVSMKPWGGLRKGDQSYLHLLELGLHKSWDQHRDDSCKTLILLGLHGCPALPPGLCCITACGLHAGFLSAGSCAPDRLNSHQNSPQETSNTSSVLTPSGL